jgi:hypothetical protein
MIIIISRRDERGPISSVSIKYMVRGPSASASFLPFWGEGMGEGGGEFET